MSLIPAQACLEQALHREFRIESGNDAVQAVLVSVQPGIGMNDRYTCYTALFRLPPGMAAAQSTYRVRHPDGEAWDLFMTPLRPGDDGLHVLQAVFHYEKSRVPAGV